MRKSKGQNELLNSRLIPRAFFSARRMLILSALVFVGGLSFIFGARPIYHLWQSRSVTQLTEQSEKLIAEEKYSEASNLLVRAYQKDKTSPVALRSIAKLLGLSNADHEKALFFWKALLETGKATLDDRVAMGLVFTATGRVAEATEILTSIPSEDRGKSGPLELESAILKQQGRNTEADPLLRKALASDSASIDSKIKLAKMDLNGSFNETNQKALDTLWSIARNSGKQGLKAVDILATEAILTAQESEELLSLAEKQKTASERHRLLALTAYLKLHPLKKNEVIKRETASHEGMSIDEAADFLGWLDSLNEHKLVLGFISKEKAIRTPELFTVYTNALASENRWAELKDIIKSKTGLPTNSITLALLNARCSNGLGESDTIVRGHLNDAIHQAVTARNIPAVMQAAQLADKLGYSEIAIEAFQNLSIQPQYRLSMLEQIYRLQAKLHYTGDMLATVEEILKSRPGLRPHVMIKDYLKLIIGMDMEEAITDDAPAKLNDLQSKPLRQLLSALSAYRQCDFQQATALASEIDANSLSAGQRAVLAGILKGCGDDQRAYSLAEKVPASLLLPEELVFLKKAL